MRSLEAKLVKKALFPTNPPQDQTRFPSPAKAKDYLLQATGLPPTVSMVGYTAVRHSGVPVFVRAFPACVNIGKISSHRHPTNSVQQIGKQRPKAIQIKSLLYRCGQFLY